MRSYYEHLETAMGASKAAVPSRPTFRSSAIFPVMQAPGISSRILFMGYWILKRNIQEIAAVITLRDQGGKVLSRSNLSIREAKTFRIELADQLESGGISCSVEFIGTMEIEFFSTQNLVFPFPAVVVNYYGPTFSTVVHTAQRVYNDFEDMNKNSQTFVPESGFNIYADAEKEPFIGLVNGPMAEHIPMRIQIFNHKQEVLNGEIDLGQAAPYETKMIYPARFFDLRQFLDGHPGTAKIGFHLKWIFPRLLAGNVHHKIPALTITHTYYDCSDTKKDSDYWMASDTEWYPAVLMVPGAVAHHLFTNVYFYPIYSPSLFAIDVEINNAEGTVLASKKNALTISSQKNAFQHIPFNALCQELNLKLENYGVRLIARPLENTRLPSRIKLGLDIGVQGSQTPCNICTNLQPFNPALKTKPTSFRWAPILADQETATVWIMDSSPAIHPRHPATIDLTFFHEVDDQVIKRTVTLPPHGFMILPVNQDEELRNFFNHQIGWVTAITTNPYTSMYYFAENQSGVIGGDHGF